MGTSEAEYVQLFLAEARENLEALDSAIIAIESDPADVAKLEAVFRVAHSIKGMAATMGYDAIAQLTHAMEDVFSLLRDDSAGVDQSVIDVLLECKDTLSQMVEEVAASGESSTDPSALEATVRELVTATGTKSTRTAKPRTSASRATGKPAARKPAARKPAVRKPAARKTSAAKAPAAKTADPVGAAIKDAQTRATVRVEAARLDTLLHMIGELVVRRSTVEQLAAELGDAKLQAAVGEMTRASQAVQEMVMRVRMVPIDTAFARLGRLVRDLSLQLGKKVELEISGGETELDRTAADALVEPLMHLVRNAIDHGIEPPEVRAKSGKPESGKLTISARHEGGDVVISISDDGAGIDRAAVIERAREGGLLDPGEELDPEQAIELLFTPGFSIRKEVSDVSGRGVGMDAVRAAVRGFGGDVAISSVPGAGTTMQLRMPLTLAILPALVVRAAGEPYALQLDRVDRTFKLEEVTTTTAAGHAVAVLPDAAVPLVSLAEAFDRPLEAKDGRFMVTVRSADRQIALVVDEMVGRRELVTRPVPEQVKRDLPVSGGAVLASGEIAFIVDCEELIKKTLVEPARGRQAK